MSDQCPPTRHRLVAPTAGAQSIETHALKPDGVVGEANRQKGAVETQSLAIGERSLLSAALVL
jgi:hypothetical protein